jgi:hypothetical protein
MQSITCILIRRKRDFAHTHTHTHTCRGNEIMEAANRVMLLQVKECWQPLQVEVTRNGLSSRASKETITLPTS